MKGIEIPDEVKIDKFSKNFSITQDYPTQLRQTFYIIQHGVIIGTASLSEVITVNETCYKFEFTNFSFFITPLDSFVAVKKCGNIVDVFDPASIEYERHSTDNKPKNKKWYHFLNRIFSLGKSILTLKEPDEEWEDSQTDSVFQICHDYGLDRVTLVEDNMAGFMIAHDNCQKLGINLQFGVRINVCNELEQEEDSSHKLLIFLKNKDGYSDLINLHTNVQTKFKGLIDYANLKELLSKNLKPAIPFYDSCIFNNTMTLKKCIPTLLGGEAVFLEDNHLPFDKVVRSKAKNFAKSNGLETLETKTIYYRKREDFKAWQTFKCMNRKTYGSGNTLNKPNLEFCASDRFCYECVN